MKAEIGRKDLPLILVSVLILFTSLYIRLRLLNMPLERDEGEYAYVAQLLLKGIPPYLYSYSAKFPGTHFFYAIFLFLFGQTTWAIHLGLLLINLGTATLVLFLGRRLFNLRAGIIGSALFLLLSASPSFLGLAAHATHFATFFGVAGILAFLNALDKEKKQAFFWSGLLFGMSYLSKQHGFFFGLFGIFVLLRSFWTEPKGDRVRIFWNLSIFSAGWIFPFAVCLGILSLAGVSGKFLFWTFAYGSKYVGRVALQEGALLFSYVMKKILADCLPTIILAIIGAVNFFKENPSRKANFILAVFLIVSLLPVFPGFLFREHYFISLIPAVALMAGLGVDLIGQRDKPKWKFPKIWAAAALIYCSGHLAFINKAVFFTLEPAKAVRRIYGANPFPESPVIGNFLREHTTPEDRIAILGSEPQILFYANRISATGFIYTYPLMEKQPYALEMQHEMAKEIEESNPKYLVLVGVDTSWLRRPDSKNFIFGWAGKIFREKYDLAGLITIGPEETQYVWGDEAAFYRLTSRAVISVFQIKNKLSPAS